MLQSIFFQAYGVWKILLDLGIGVWSEMQYFGRSNSKGRGY